MHKKLEEIDLLEYTGPKLECYPTPGAKHYYIYTYMCPLCLVDNKYIAAIKNKHTCPTCYHVNEPRH